MIMNYKSLIIFIFIALGMASCTDDFVEINKDPNAITQEDFKGWVQERGLYFATQWDGGYETVLASHDGGESDTAGGLLFTRFGDGVFIYTGISWFRQLPAGVPGAYRLFANMISSGHGHEN